MSDGACQCACHASSGTFAARCTIDTGSSGVPGIPSCSPCTSEPGPCGRCGAVDGQAHQWTEGDCILPHRKHSTRLVAGSFVCEPCVERHLEWLAEILDLYSTLGDVLLAGSIPDDTAEHQRVKKAPASPSPIRLDAWALLTGRVNDHIDIDKQHFAAYLGSNLPDIPAVLCGWAQAVHDLLYSNATAPTTVSGAIAVLSASGEDLARDPSIDDYDAELRWVRKALRAAHGITNPDPIGPCLTVSCRGTVWPDRGDKPKCDRCRRRYDVHDIVRLHAQQRAS